MPGDKPNHPEVIVQSTSPAVEAGTNRTESRPVQLAEAHLAVGLTRQPDVHPPPLIDFLDNFERLLREAVLYFRGAQEGNLVLSYATEWVLDNYFIALQALREIRQDLPQKFYRQLPKLAGGPLAGYPRIFDLARKLAADPAAPIELDEVAEYVHSYQSLGPLTMGELWALPIMLRLIVVERLVLAACRVASLDCALEGYPQQPDYRDLDKNDGEIIANGFISLRTLAAEDWKDFFERLSLTEAVLHRDPAGLYSGMDFETRDHYRKQVEEVSLEAGVDELQVAREAVRLAQSDLDREGLGSDHRNPSTRQPAHREVPLLFDELSFDPINNSPMDGNRPSGGEPWDHFQTGRASHVGYYLLDRGREDLEHSLGYHPTGRRRLARRVFARPALVYLGSIGLLAAVLTSLFTVYSAYSGVNPLTILAAALLSLIPAITIAVPLVNWVFTKNIPPHVLPKMDFEKGLPEDCSTLVVIPALLSSLEDIQDLLRQIELHYLRNPQPQFSYALLTDFADASEEQLPEDEQLVSAAVQGVKALNTKHKRDRGEPFLLLHRKRTWNPSERRWIGWERKRGKLHDLNRMILEGQDESFSIRAGDLSRLSSIRYVITLDADTILPRGAAPRLAAALAHPLNRAEFGPDDRVTAGYTILQPRTEISPTSSGFSWFTRLFAGDRGLDLYTLAVSDIYQDLFGEGIYVGKGIYDIRAFEKSLSGRGPENALLSHDLFEGIHGRAGLVTDVVLIEDYPPHYLVHIKRLHRWVRGDWQLLPWLLPSVPAGDGPDERVTGLDQPAGRRLPNQLSAISRWKILDNLRRSLVAPFLLLLLVMSWLWLPGSPLVWGLLALGALGTPALIQLLETLWGGMHGLTLQAGWNPLRNDLARWFLAVVFLPYEALVNLDAILGTLLRLLVTRRGMLRWTTSAQSASLLEKRFHSQVTWRQMASALILVALLGLLVMFFRPAYLVAALPFLFLWLLSPEVAYWISQPIRRRAIALEPEDYRDLQKLARRTWLFMEQFIGPEDHWLPPDHYQEVPLGVVAHRTSPTNIGLALLSTLGAYDLGYLGLLDLAARLRSTFETLDELERYRGHFYNWYDTQTLELLNPRYISTVDSGNLAACLIALKEGCREVTAAPVLRWETWRGFLDILNLLDDLLGAFPDPEVRQSISGLNLKEMLNGIRKEVLQTEGKVERWLELADRLLATGEASWSSVELKLGELVETCAHSIGAEDLRRLRIFSSRVRSRLEALQRGIDMLLPWSRTLGEVPDLFNRADLPSDVRLAWRSLFAGLPLDARLNELHSIARAARLKLDQLQAWLDELDGTDPAVRVAEDWCKRLAAQLEEGGTAAKVLVIAFEEFQRQAEAFALEMDFAFLFDSERQVFHIGYNATEGSLDSNYYDLLASESRLASLVAIAKGDIPQSHWLHLSRPFTAVAGMRALLSWSATMFEYLMPVLLSHSYPGTLLDHSGEVAVSWQMTYAAQKGVPWGISESGYYRFDANQFYQYRAFGVPGLGYKRGLGEDLVITPYASLLALPLRPEEVVENLKAFARLGMFGTYGLYEAIDFTPARLSFGNRYEIVRSYMAHHQGMIFLSLVNYLTAGRMVARFHADLRIQSIELLLQEQLPEVVPLDQPHAEDGQAARPVPPKVVNSPWRARVMTPQPRAHYLSNGKFGTLITSSGAGFSNWGETDLTRWRADTTLNHWGQWIYVQDLESGALWSAGQLPTTSSPQSRDVFFSAHMAEFRRRDGEISLVMEITVAPEHDVEIRRLSLTNHGSRPHRLQLTSYAEVVLAPQSADARHPAFNKLFIESEYVPDQRALLFRRRPRAGDEPPVFLAHSVVVEGEHQRKEKTVSYETDRLRFLGRGRTVRHPEALQPAARMKRLSGTTGATLDPILALSQEIEIQPHERVELAFLTAAAGGRAEVLSQLSRYRSWSAIGRAFELARTLAEAELRRMGLQSEILERFQELFSALVYPNEALRVAPEVLAANQKGQPGLWAYSISGDFPILLVEVSRSEDLSLVQELLQAHVYWRKRNLKIDLIILNTQAAGYDQELNNAIRRLLVKLDSEGWLNRRGGIFMLSANLLGAGDQDLIETVARVVLYGDRGSLEDQLAGVDDLHRLPPRLPAFLPVRQPNPEEKTSPLPRPAGLQFDNGLGGFSRDGREYVIYLEPGRWTPAPWVNVIANREFGCLVTESGGGYSWSLNSGENRLTPWSNDPVSDPPGEAIYLRDEETAEIWSPTPLPARASAPYLIRHGAGYTVFEHHSHGLKQVLEIFIAPDAPVKILRLRLENELLRTRRITATYYVEWVLGVMRETSQQYVMPEFDGESQALLGRNPYQPEFGERVAFAAASKELHGMTTDRTEFLGRMGTRARPAALRRIGLSGTVRAGVDPCAALMLHLDLQQGEAQEIYFLLGQGANQEEAVRLAKKFQDPDQVSAAWEAGQDFWDQFLGTVTVETPEPAMDLLLNRWLLYQALACRIWARTAFYQSSGAYGFRDQLQDVMALLLAAPDLARQHLLRSARHQFEAGDVLHWWHPPSGRGVRTRFSDDLLWLPYVIAEYVSATGDTAVLEEKVPFLHAPLLEPKEVERYSLYPETREVYTLWEHCRRAVEKGATSGSHNLPLMGGGDWNDGMNRVGIAGRGESIWLGWFLYDIFLRFADLCEHRGSEEQAAWYRNKAHDLQAALEKNAWDGDWYLRAFYDDGAPIGSAANRECQIDSIAQSWAVLSKAGDPERVERAMRAVLERLVRPEDGLILLFTPPFNKTTRDPGYIKGYLPGTRENGGQYTHAALWTVWAFARMGQGDTAENLFRLLNPIYHSDTPEKVAQYRVEPYVVAADVYSVAPHIGRGGWTWYTGSSGWMYRLGLEAILGLRREGDYLVVDPCIPRRWPAYTIHYRNGETRYEIRVENPQGVNRGVNQVYVDGEVQPDGKIPLKSDGREHKIVVTLGL